MRRGLSAFTLVGLPDRAVRESRERVRAALLNSGLEFPQKRITVNLAPAHVRKEGPSFDLAIAVGVLAASEQVPQEPLARLRPVRRALADGRAAARARRARHGARRARRCGYAACSCRRPTPGEAALVEEIEVRGIPSLARIADLLHGRWLPERARAAAGAPGRRGGRPARPRRRARPGRRQAGARDRGRRRSQPVDDRPARRRARRCSRGACPGCCRRRASRRRSRSRRCTAPPGLGGGRLATERPVPRAAPHDLGAGAGRRRQPPAARARSRSPTAGCCSSTSCRSSAAPRVDALRQPLEDGRVDDHARAASARLSRATRWWWRPATAARARGRRTAARARQPSWRATCAA